MVYFDDNILTHVSPHIRDWLGVSFLLREVVIGILWGGNVPNESINTASSKFNTTALSPYSVSVHE